MTRHATISRAARGLSCAATLLVSLAIGGASLRAAPAAASRPNIIFLLADDHAAHAIGAYGSRINSTPNIDRLARGGVLFRNCFATNSICGPSRAVILTGKHSHINGMIDNRSVFDGSQPTVAKRLSRSGYQCAMVGKWHLKSEPTGFDFWNVLRGQGTYYNPVFLTPAGRVQRTGYTTDIITDVAIDWIENGRDRTRPFLLMCHHKAPHRNWVPGPAHLSMYRGKMIPEPPTLFDDWAHRASPARLQKMTVANHLTPYDLKLVPPRGLNDKQLAALRTAYAESNDAMKKASLEGKALVRWKYQRYIKDYLRCIASVDDNVGRLLDYLDRSGLAASTVVIYSSDQGFFLGDHGWFDKRFMYEESSRMPLIVRWPGVVKPGSVNTNLVQNLDFAPTFLDMAGAPPASDMQGRSLVPLLKGAAPPDWRTSVYYHYYEFPGAHSVRRHYGVRTKRYKLISYYDIGEWELFDLKKDPAELRDVYGDSAYAGTVANLKTELGRLQAACRDTHPNAPSSSLRRKLNADLVWSDEFDGETLDETKWAYRSLGKRRDAINVKDAVRLDGKGHLVLTTRRAGDAFHTGMIGTQGKFERTFGYFECRVKLQKRPGHWSAFWLQSPRLGKTIGDPARSGTEIDIFEYLAIRGDKIQHTLHWDGYQKDHKSKGHVADVPGISEGWHTVGLEWTKDAYTFYVDGRRTWTTNVGVSRSAEYIILSLEVGKWGGDIRKAALPDSVLFDYVRVYRKRPKRGKRGA